MSNVPHRTNTRTSHARGVGSRDTHTEDAYLPPIEASAQVFKQTNIDGIVSQQDIIPGAVGTPELRDSAVTGVKIESGSIHVGQMGGNPGNLCTNPDFEDLTGHLVGTFIFPNNPLRGWKTFSPDMGASWRTRGDTFKFGASSYQHLRPGDTVQADSMSDLVPVQGGRRMRLRAWYRGEAGNNAGAQLQIFIRAFLADKTTFAAANAPINSGVITVGAGTTWTEYSDFGVLGSDVAYVWVNLRHTGTTGGTTDSVRFDGIELYYADDDVSHAAGDVVIDKTGITINNGKLIIQDEFGETTMVASGFSGSWEDFLGTGLYNGNFTSNPGTTPVAGRTVHIPYWTLVTDAGTPTYVGVTNGIAVTLGSSGTGCTYKSDRVRVVSGRPYYVSIAEMNNATGTNVTRRDIYIERLNAAGGSISTTLIDTRYLSSNGGTINYLYTNTDIFSSAVSASDTVFVRVHVKVAWDSAASGSPKYACAVVSLVRSVSSSPITEARFDETADQTLTTTPTTIGSSITGYPVGIYLLVLTWDFNVTASGVGACVGELYYNGNPEPDQGVWDPASTGRATIEKTYLMTVEDTTDYFESKVWKTVGAGTATVVQQHTVIKSIKIG